MNGTESTPRAPEAEKQVGSILLLPEIMPEVAAIVRPQDFFEPAERATFQAMHDLHAAGLPIETAMLVDKLRASASKFTDDKPAVFLLELAGEVATAAHAPHYAKQVVEARRKRQLLGIAETAVEGSLNGHTADDVYRTLTADVEDYRRDVEAGMPQFPLITALELATAQFALNYLVERVLVEGQPCVLGGPKKSLKTTIALLLAICIALGIDLFGKFRVDRPRRVLFASSESGMGTIQETALRMCAALGIELAELSDNLTFTTKVPRPNDAESLAAFRAVMQETGAEVVFFDPFYKMFNGDGQESIFKMGAVLDKLSEMCDELGATWILCHHFKTGRLNQYAPAELDDLAYAGCAEHFRQWLLLSRRSEYKPGSGEHALWLTVGGSAGHNSLWALDINEGSADDPGGRRWEATLQRADEARDAAAKAKANARDEKAQQQHNEDATAICRVLAKHPDGCSKTHVRDTCGVSGRRFPIVFANLYDDGAIVDCDVIVGNKKTPQPGFKLS